MCTVHSESGTPTSGHYRFRAPVLAAAESKVQPLKRGGNSKESYVDVDFQCRDASSFSSFVGPDRRRSVFEVSILQQQRALLIRRHRRGNIPA